MFCHFMNSSVWLLFYCLNGILMADSIVTTCPVIGCSVNCMFFFPWPITEDMFTSFLPSSRLKAVRWEQCWGGWTVTLHRRNKPNTCHRAHFQLTETCSVELAWQEDEHIFCFVFKVANAGDILTKTAKHNLTFVAFISSTV